MEISKYNKSGTPFRMWIAAVLLLCLFPLVIKSQVILSETFDNTSIPAAWTIEQQPLNWSVSASSFAGGTSREMMFSGTPAFFNYSYLISPLVNLSSVNLAKLEFKYTLNHNNTSYSFGVAARNGNGAWNVLWSIVPLNSMDSVKKTIVINYPGFNTSSFQFAFFFQGNSQNITSIFLDDVKLYLPPLHDLAVSEIINPDVYLPNTTIIPSIAVSNEGQLSETNVTAFCKIYDGNNNLVYNNQSNLNLLAGAAQDTMFFPSYVLAFANDYYRIVTAVISSNDTFPANDTLSKSIKTLTMVNRRYVMTETGTATWCVSCPAASMAIEDHILSGKQMAVAEYHSPYSDPFNNIYATDRIDYYGIAGYPTAVFDGILTYVGNSNVYNEYANLYNQRMNVPSPYDINIYGSHTGNQYTLNVVLYRMAPVNHQNLVLRVLLTESSINYNWLGQTHVDHAVRLMIPGAEGIPVDLVNHVQLNVPLTFNMQAGWIPENCELIAFLQDSVTKEVLQTNKRTYFELVPMGFQKIQGYVRYRNSYNTPLAGVNVKLRLGGGIVASTTTTANGYYSFSGIAPGSYYLSCSYNGSWGGVNASDALKIINYFTGLEPLDPIQIKASDNDVTNVINAADALTVMQRFVGMILRFNQSDWVFESPVILLPNSTIVNKNIKGLCTGDVNGSHIP